MQDIRDQIMGDQRFWERLEYEACHWLKDSTEQHVKGFWIDGFLPETVTNTKHGADVEGTAWVGEGTRTQQSYRFTVSLPQKMLHRRPQILSIDSLSLDAAGRTLQISVSGGN
jgi:hypothetical protein